MIYSDFKGFESSYEIVGSAKGLKGIEWLPLAEWLEHLPANAKLAAAAFSADKISPGQAVMQVMPFRVVLTNQAYIMHKRKEEEDAAEEISH